jgi:chemotaxis protein methyltransferase CheR
MVLEEFRATRDRFNYGILATDISTRALEHGSKAIYPEDRIDPVPHEMRKKYFLRSKDRSARLVRVRPELRKRVQFHRLNLMHDSYDIHDRFEVIFCRNVIIYFERPTQYRLLTHLYEYLVPGGYLFLGHSETLAGMELPLFSVAPTIYRKAE